MTQLCYRKSRKTELSSQLSGDRRRFDMSAIWGNSEYIGSLRVLLALSSRPEEFHLGALPEPCMTLSSHTAPDVRPLLERLCLVHGLLPFPVWPMAKAEQRSPFAPAPLQGLRRYYGRLRPCAPLRYSRPRGWSRLRLVPSRHRRDEAQVLMFHTKAWSNFAPPACRMPLGQYQGIPRADPGGRVTPRF